MKFEISTQKIFGALSVLLVMFVSLTPNTLHIPLVIRPWVFIFSIAWSLMVFSGVFSS